MQWDDIVPDRSGLLPGASMAAVQAVEECLGVPLPQEFVSFLLWADGGQIAQRKFIVYSAGAGIHPSETLLSANRGLEGDFPLLLAGRESEEEFGFKKSDLPSVSAPVYFYVHDEGHLDKTANSFREFVQWMFKHLER